jgi:DnaJ-class molecular chaperone
MKCPPCNGTGKSPSTPTANCLCCKGKKEITQKHFDALQKISSDLSKKLKL